MAGEAIGSLNLQSGYTVLDATLGGGGHALRILDRIMPAGRLLGIDADPAALKRMADNIQDRANACALVHDNFRRLDAAAAAHGIAGLDAALFDLGVSSFQLDEGARGFSMRLDAPLDMRMDPRGGVTAADIVNRTPERELADIIWKYGEERYSRKIARWIVEQRARSPLRTTGELADLIRRAVGSRYRKQKIDPATRTFQAIRIAVNDELGALQEALEKAVRLLKPGARIAVIAFHSLEDRIIKNYFRSCAREGILRLVTKKPLRPSEGEAQANPRSRSARLRVAEKV